MPFFFRYLWLCAPLLYKYKVKSNVFSCSKHTGINMATIETNLPIVAAIDFGTSNSGFAFAFRSECSESRVGEIHKSTWQGRGGARGKAPTTALFDKDMKLYAFGFDAQDEYARLTENKQHEGWHYFKHFKMQLHGKMQLKRDYEIKDESGQSFPAQQVFSESIKYLKKQLIERLQVSNPMTEQAQKKKRDYEKLIKWVITIPAIWNEPAKQFMREAAIKAGIPSKNLIFALEPEAAAVFCKSLRHGTFKDSQDEDVINAFKPGGKYMILDLGGGTVDIAVHQVAEDGNLMEVVKASGGAWGGSHVNETFFSYISEMFGEDYVKQYSQSHLRDWMQLNDKFEERKKSFAYDSKLDEVFHIEFPVRFVIESKAKVDLQSYNKFSLLNKKLKDFYDASIKQITQHVSKILNDVGQLNLILMIGGYANSDYILGVIQNEYPDMRIIRPLMAETAVLDGAVMFGFFPMSVSARVCRFTYGIEIHEPFEENNHLPQYKREVDGDLRCINIFEVVVEEGKLLQNVETKEITSLTSTHRDPSLKFIHVTIPIFASTKMAPKYTTDETCTYLGDIKLHPPENGWPDRVKHRVVCYFGSTEFSVKFYNDADDSEFKATFDFLIPE